MQRKGGMGRAEKPRAVIVGGSIAGLSSAHALRLAGWETVVLEKSRCPPNKSPTGAGLGLDQTSRRFIESWLDRPELLHRLTLPLSIDQVPLGSLTKVLGCGLFVALFPGKVGFGLRAMVWPSLRVQCLSIRLCFQGPQALCNKKMRVRCYCYYYLAASLVLITLWKDQIHGYK